MSVFNSYPILFLNSLTYFHFMIWGGLLTLHQYAGINLVGQYSGYCLGTPDSFRVHLKRCLKANSYAAFIFHGGQDALLVQNFRNFVLAKAIDLHAEYILHHRTGVCINNKLIFVFWVFQISVTGEGSDKLAILTFDRQMAPDFNR